MAKAPPEEQVAVAKAIHKTTFRRDNEWYTPPEIIERARKVMGGIDLDPASNGIAQDWIKAAKFYSAEEDGLKHSWRGRIWLNPPYSQPEVAYFAQKLVIGRQIGNIEAAILLVNNCTETEWFQKAAASCDAICFPRGRIDFISPTRASSSPAQGQAFLYYGLSVESFEENFGELGLVYRSRA